MAKKYIGPWKSKKNLVSIVFLIGKWPREQAIGDILNPNRR